MSITTLVGLSFGVFPCLLFGFIMLLSLLVCEYIEEYVAKHLCAWKNRRRRGLRSVYRDFRDRGNDSPGNSSNHHYPHYSSSRSRTVRVGGGPTPDYDNDHHPDEMRLLPELISPTAPPAPHQLQYGPAQSTSRSLYPILGGAITNDPPPSYEECVLPRGRWQRSNSQEKNSASTSPSAPPPPPNKPSRKSSKD